jgi:hypothetical protein
MAKARLGALHAQLKRSKPTKAQTTPAQPTIGGSGQYSRTPGGFIRKTIYLQPDEWEAVRQRAFSERTSESEVIRAAVRVDLKLP